MPGPRDTSKPADQVGSFRILPGPVEIVRLEFKHIESGADEKPAGEIEVTFGTGAARVSQNEIVVQLEATVHKAREAHVVGAARCRLRIELTEGVKVDYDAEVARIAGQVAPVVIFPYLREVIADISRRGGLAPITLPVYQIGRMFTFDRESLVWQPPDTEESEEREPKPKQKSKAKK